MGSKKPIIKSALGSILIAFCFYSSSIIFAYLPEYKVFGFILYTIGILPLWFICYKYMTSEYYLNLGKKEGK